MTNRMIAKALPSHIIGSRNVPHHRACANLHISNLKSANLQMWNLKFEE